MLYCISIDWFQYYCHKSVDTNIVYGMFFKGLNNNKDGKLCMYEVCQAEEFHSMYRDAYTIKCDKLSMVHVYMTPKMASINPNSVSIKVANRLLYKSDWSWYLHDIIDALHIVIKNITRIDLCMDFQRFSYCNMTPSEFMHHYLQDQSVATEDTFIREGSNNYCVYGKKKITADDGSTEINDNTPISVSSHFEYIRFGSRSSGVCTYLYNKSQELRDKKSKPWIRDRWNDAGLYENNGDIYRLEFSISAKGMMLKKSDKKKGMKAPSSVEIHKLSRSDLETQRSLENIFVCYQAKYFAFRLVGKQKYRKDMKPIQLFDYSLVPTMLPSYYNTRLNQGKAERNAGVTLQRLQWQCKDLPTDQMHILYKAQQILESLSVQIRDLRKEELEHPIYLKKIHHADKVLLDSEVVKAIDSVLYDYAMAREQFEHEPPVPVEDPDAYFDITDFYS